MVQIRRTVTLTIMMSHVAKDQWGTVSLSFLWADMNDGRARARDRPFGAHHLSSVKMKWPKSAEFSYLMYFWTYYFFIPRFVVCVKVTPFCIYKKKNIPHKHDCFILPENLSLFHNHNYLLWLMYTSWY